MEFRPTSGQSQTRSVSTWRSAPMPQGLETTILLNVGCTTTMRPQTRRDGRERALGASRAKFSRLTPPQHDAKDQGMSKHCFQQTFQALLDRPSFASPTAPLFILLRLPPRGPGRSSHPRPHSAISLDKRCSSLTIEHSTLKPQSSGQPRHPVGAEAHDRLMMVMWSFCARALLHAV